MEYSNLDLDKSYSEEERKQICEYKNENGFSVYIRHPFYKDKILYRCQGEFTYSNKTQQCNKQTLKYNGFCGDHHQGENGPHTEEGKKISGQNGIKHGFFQKYLNDEDTLNMQLLKDMSLEDKITDLLHYSFVTINRSERIVKLRENKRRLFQEIENFLEEKVAANQCSMEAKELIMDHLLRSNTALLFNAVKSLIGLIEKVRDFDKSKINEKLVEALWAFAGKVFNAWADDGSERQENILNEITVYGREFDRDLQEIYQGNPEALNNNNIYNSYIKHVYKELEKTDSEVKEVKRKERNPNSPFVPKIVNQ